MPHRPFVLLFFALTLALGLSVVNDYGIGADEYMQRMHGRVFVDYVADRLGIEDYEKLQKNKTLEEHYGHAYGPIYPMTTVVLEEALDQHSYYERYRLRHIVIFVLFWLAVIAFYRMLRQRWPAERWLPLLGAGLLFCTPRLFADAFHNPKDAVVLCFLLYGSWSLLRLIREDNWRNLLLHSLMTGLALNTRITALFLPLATVLLFTWAYAVHRPRQWKKLLGVPLYLGLTLLATILTNPYLWETPFTHLAEIFTTMSAFDWSGEVLFLGEIVDPKDLPWYYIPGWIAVTTPPVDLCFVVLGVVGVTYRRLRGLPKLRLWTSREGMMDLAMLGLAVGPLVAVVVLNSTLYNGWRHMHFIYPPLLFLGMWAVVRTGRWMKWAPAGYVLAGIGLLATVAQLYRLHPYQQVYFNGLAPSAPTGLTYDMDYWGLAFRRSFTELAESVPDGQRVKVYCSPGSCQDNLRSLPPELVPRLKQVKKLEEADFAATQFRNREEVRKAYRREGRYAYPRVEIYAGNNLINGIYDLRRARGE